MCWGEGTIVGEEGRMKGWVNVGVGMNHALAARARRQKILEFCPFVTFLILPNFRLNHSAL
jgi:hypothetical protein